MKKTLSILTWPIRFFMRGSWRIKTIVIIAILVVIGAVNHIVKQQDKTNGYVIEEAKIDSVTEIVSESGVIKQSGRTDVYSPATGIVKDVSVINGQIVQEGDELFAVESTATNQEQQTAYAAYLSAQSTLNTAKSTANTLRSTMYTQWDKYFNIATNDTYETEDGNPKEDKRESVEFQTSKEDWLASEKKFKNQQIAITAAQADVSSKRDLYLATQDAVVVAPTDGTVANLSIAVGDSIEAINSTAVAFGTSGTIPSLIIVNDSRVSVVVSIGQTDIAKVRVGQTVTFYPDAYKDITYKGSVVRVDSIGDNSSGVVKYNIYMNMIDKDDRIFSGMSLDADIYTNKLENVLTVPNEAVKPYKGGKAVRIVGEDGKPKFVPVKVGVKGRKRMQILSGIEEGQEIIVSLSNENLKRSGGWFGF